MARTVLIVDDNPELLTLYERAFRDLGGDLQVIVATDGAQGLERFFDTQPHPACVVIDVKMPQLDGNQLVRALRGDPQTAEVPLIILTAMAQDDDRMRGLASGADVYLTKPVMPHDLIVAIQQAIAISSEQRRRDFKGMVHQLLSDAGE